ncbi:MAG: phosphonate metabolism protein/1,5-bisphosphokinase (PRPP-forming) PhnN [Thalassobaculales bacterium]
MQGALVLVVGPSGVGKDSILAGARAALADDPMVVFPRRVITRLAEAGGEDHLPASEDAFEAAAAQGAFALSWRAHGLGYGVPAAIRDERAAGRTVVVNVSRTVIATAEADPRLAPVRVAAITASPAVLARRLAARGREDEAQIAARLARSVPLAGANVATIANDGALADAVAALLAVIRGPSAQSARSA